MKIIDLLNKIAHGEEVPEVIKWEGIKLIYYVNSKCYWDDEGNDLFSLIQGIDLNNEIEVIEEPKQIEKIKDEVDIFEDSYYDTALLKLAGKIDELIDHINKLEKESE